jgi:hypothetical protein
MTTKRITTALLVAMGVLLAGCGGSGDGDDGVASLDAGDGEATEAAADDADNEEALMDWVECMRDEGIALDDPVRDEDGNLQISGPGIQIGSGGASAGSGPPPDAPDEADLPDREVMESARDACGDPPPIVGNERGEVDEQAMQETMLAFAECMRAEGATDFPDPDFSGSGPGGMATEREVEDDGSTEDGPSQRVMIGPFGEIDLDDPTISAAFEACQDVLGMPDGGGPPPEGSDEDGAA